MKKIAIIWLWHISKFFINSIKNSDTFKLFAICDINSELLNFYTGESIYKFIDYKEIWEIDGIDAVIISTPNFSHYEMIDYFIDKRIDILCEKPLTIDYITTKKLIRKAKKEWVILQTAFHRRYNKKFVDFLELNIKKDNFKIINLRYLENIKEHSLWEEWYKNTSKSWWGCVIDNWINTLDLLYNLIWEYKIINSYIWYKNSRYWKYDDNSFIELLYKNWKAYIELDWSYVWEKKDISIFTWEQVIRLDFLEWYTWFKESLYHEYDGILNHFYNTIINDRNFYDKSVLLAMETINTIYNEKKWK